MFIYSISNLKDNNKKYIGISIIPIDDRKYYFQKEKEHILSILYSARSSKLHTAEEFSKLVQAFLEYDLDSFKWEVLETHNNARELCERQQYYITLYDTFHNGYNNVQGLPSLEYFKQPKKQELTFEKVQQIKQLLAKDVSIRNLAKQFKCSTSTISLIRQGKAWRDEDYDAKGIKKKKPKVKVVPKTLSDSYSPEEIKNIYNHILSGKYTPPELMKILNLSKDNFQRFVRRIKDEGYTVTYPKRNPAISDEQAREIKLKLQSGLKQLEIAEQYEVGRQVIAAIQKGVTYAHVTV